MATMLPRILGAAVLALGVSVHAGELPEHHAKSVRTVVQAQLDAFAADDARRAFELAVPSIRTQFGSAEKFLAMVRAHYPMVHRPRQVTFLKPDSDGTMAYQRVRVSDTTGAQWLVTYLLQQQKDKQWRISACLVTPESARVTT